MIVPWNVEEGGEVLPRGSWTAYCGNAAIISNDKLE
jgi:hypothetical protein